MPTPPIQRRNPTVSVRRVQSERKYLSPWGSVSPCPIWKPQFEHARKTAIIPPLGNAFIGTPVGTHPYMLGTSQGILGSHVLRGVPSLYPHLPTHPMILVAPPLFVRGYSSPPLNGGTSKATEGELLAQERIATFLTEETPPHKPRSLLSYPDSHLYESLISQLSDLNAEDISLEFDYLTFDSSPNWTIERLTKPPIESLTSSKTSNRESIKIGDCKKAPPFSEKVEEKNKRVQNSENNTLNNLRKISFGDIQEKNLENNSQKQLTKTLIERNFPKTFHDNKLFHKKDDQTVSKNDKEGNLFSNIPKPISKLKEKKEYKKGNNLLQPTQTVVSVVHVNKENGIDEASFRESTCYKCGGTSQRSQSSSSNATEHYDGSSLSSPINQKTTIIQNNKDHKGLILKNNIDVPRTIELLESQPSSQPNSSLSQASFVSKKSPFPSMEFCSFESLSSQDSTLDPLKPTSLENTKRVEPLVPKVITKNFKNISTSHDKDIKNIDYILPQTINFDSEDSSTDEEDSLRMFSSYDYHESDSESILEFYSIATTRPDSFVYVYRSPCKSDRSKSSSRTSSMSLRFNLNLRKGTKEQQANESSGLGSSGSDDSFEDVSIQFPSSSNGSSTSRDLSIGSSGKSTVTFLEPSFRPSKHTKTTPPSCNRLSFDYSCSWTDLNTLVKNSSSPYRHLKHEGQNIYNNSHPDKFLNQKENYKFSSTTYTKKTICS